MATAVALVLVLAEHLKDSVDLLDEPSIILITQCFITLGDRIAAPLHPKLASATSVSTGAYELKDISPIGLALLMPGNFNFYPHNLTELVRDRILNYWDHDVTKRHCKNAWSPGH
ncbi:hypothetical protein H4R34_005761 [Dimargaris verticillata]|uniref:Uncharacterized protein n=1 Tax=Dimargaris verticillata TaxID=2761393 RepID=A0A9W8EAY5_9FUNG|nr:hypothetical protein H4R34_005761 [Dimargaris verticillata]